MGLLNMIQIYGFYMRLCGFIIKFGCNGSATPCAGSIVGIFLVFVQARGGAITKPKATNGTWPAPLRPWFCILLPHLQYILSRAKDPKNISKASKNIPWG